jgi:hypothetical protein
MLRHPSPLQPPLELPRAPSFEAGAVTIFCYLAVPRQV